MTASNILFITMRWSDVLDIFLVAGLLYMLYSLVRGTAAIKIIIGIVIILGFWKVVQVLQMDLTANILGQFIGMGAIAVIIIFQPELRRFLLRVGTNRFFKDFQISSLFNFPVKGDSKLDIDALSSVIYNLSITKTGALIVIARRSDLTSYIETGRKMDARFSPELLETIFVKNSPLHDGAVVIAGNTVKAASCVLPVTDRSDIQSNFGLRHRAAMGAAELTDAVIIVVSEERGSVHIFRGHDYIKTDRDRFTTDLKKFLK